jgi:hypothetical protein
MIEILDSKGHREVIVLPKKHPVVFPNLTIDAEEIRKIRETSTGGRTQLITVGEQLIVPLHIDDVVARIKAVLAV